MSEAPARRKLRKDTAEPRAEYVAGNGDKLKRENGKIWSWIRQRWLVETPEEYVRQEYLLILLHEYGFKVEQVAEEEEVTGRGSGHARADFVVWRTPADKDARKPPLIIVECKSDNITIRPQDYAQGDNYARLTDAPFVVTHNNNETKFWRVRKDKMPGYLEEIENIPHADATDKQIEELFARLKVFKENEFAELLHQCHNVIRNREKKDPVAAFDEIAKILFVKVFVERELKAKRRRKNLFNVEYLEEQLGDNPLEDLFQKTKEHYRKDRIFGPDERLNLKPATGMEIVRLLERYNLSDTSEDIKGIAFERFLGRTFRGEIGQFFTPRPIVEFMVRVLAPQEGEIVCDPASGSGGFLIRFFEIVREHILADADRQYQAYRREIDSKRMSEEKKAEALRIKYEELQKTIDKDLKDSRLWMLANRCIYGTDANDRMARTSKMNMIMHGDGHGGVHHHDGFLNVNGIFEGRFDVILTNPPFGSNVEPSDKVLDEQVTIPEELERYYFSIYGDLYRKALARVRASKGKPIATLFELPTIKGNSKLGKIKTEILFIERCLDLLRPGGRLGIVLPEGIFNNPSLAYVREFCEDRARILAVVSLPQETFLSSGASVKASLLFVVKFTDKEQVDFDKKQAAARKEIEARYAGKIAAETSRLEAVIDAAKVAKDAGMRKAAQSELREYLKRMEGTTTREARALLKERFDYPIFLYEAEKVGITATGEPDANELYPNDRMPAGMQPEATCLGLYLRFRKKPAAFALPASGGGDE
jgi:type I restriction enzyme M protein